MTNTQNRCVVIDSLSAVTFSCPVSSLLYHASSCLLPLALIPSRHFCNPLFTMLQVYTDRDLSISVHMISGKKASRERAALLDLVATSSKLLTAVQARVLLECLDDPMEKVSFYSRIMTKIVDDPVGKGTLSVLSEEEQQVPPPTPPPPDTYPSTPS
jgi:hypothetical protein